MDGIIGRPARKWRAQLLLGRDRDVRRAQAQLELGPPPDGEKSRYEEGCPTGGVGRAGAASITSMLHLHRRGDRLADFLQQVLEPRLRGVERLAALDAGKFDRAQLV